MTAKHDNDSTITPPLGKAFVGFLDNYLSLMATGSNDRLEIEGIGQFRECCREFLRDVDNGVFAFTMDWNPVQFVVTFQVHDGNLPRVYIWFENALERDDRFFKQMFGTVGYWRLNDRVDNRTSKWERDYRVYVLEFVMPPAMVAPMLRPTLAKRFQKYASDSDALHTSDPSDYEDS